MSQPAVDFVDYIPSQGRSQGYDWWSISRVLRQRPGEWALIFEQDRSSLVNTLRAGRVIALRPDDGFEVVTRNNINVEGQPRLCDLYMRWNPAAAIVDERPPLQCPACDHPAYRSEKNLRKHMSVKHPEMEMD